MKKKSLIPLGESEMEVLQIIWNGGSMSVSDVRKELLKNRDVAYTTVMTTLKKLAEKGFLKYIQKGNSYVYSAAQDPQSVKGGVIDSIVNKVFQGSKVDLIASLVKQEDSLKADEVTALEKILKQLKNNPS